VRAELAGSAADPYAYLAGSSWTRSHDTAALRFLVERGTPRRLFRL
jgi:hypothetical protein